MSLWFTLAATFYVVCLVGSFLVLLWCAWIGVAALVGKVIDYRNLQAARRRQLQDLIHENRVLRYELKFAQVRLEIARRARPLRLARPIHQSPYLVKDSK